MIRLRVLAVEDEILSLLEAPLLEAVYEALVGGIQRAVFDELNDADLILTLGAFRRSSLLRPAAAGGEPRRESSDHGDGEGFSDVFSEVHIYPS